MAGLTGDFQAMPLKDLVVYLGNRQVTGTLSLERTPTVKQVVLQDGDVVNASSNLPLEFLGQFLINLGHITEEQFHRAYATQQETRVFLGRILTMIGLVQEETIASVLAVKFRETLLEAFDWKDGTFNFQLGVRPQLPDGLSVRVPLLDIHKESDFRVQAWERFRAAFPSGNCTLVLHRENLVDPPKPGSLDEKVLSFVETGMTLDEMALRLHATNFFLYNRLYALYSLKVIEVVQPRSSDADGAEPSLDGVPPEELLEDARAYFKEGKHREAWASVRKVADGPIASEAAAVLRMIEAAWMPKLRAKLVTGMATPRLVVAPEDISKLPLSAPERYLLSRMDGKRDVDRIIRAAPLKEFEALAFLDRFVAQRWVELA